MCLSRLALSQEGEGMFLDVVLTYSLIPKPEPGLLDGYLKTLASDADRDKATRLIANYAEPRILTFRTMPL